jgi:hypothetical protein
MKRAPERLTTSVILRMLAIIVVYGVRSLSHLVASVAQLHGTLHTQTGNCTTDYLNKVFLLPPFTGTHSGEVIAQLLVQHPLFSH